MSYRLLLSVALLSATSGYAQTPAPMPRKIAIIDFDRAVLMNTDGIKARAQLEVQVKHWKDQEDSITAKLKPLNDRLNDPKLSETEKAAIRKQITEINLNLTRNGEDARHDIETRRTTLFTGIAERVKSVLKTYSEEQNLALVINDSASGPESPIIAKSEVADITSEIVRRVNADIEKNPAKVPDPIK
jgi:Skp family chaperone for outer membrane proteins